MTSAVLSFLCFLGTISVSESESKLKYFTTVDQKWLDAASLTALESSPDTSFTQLAMRTSAGTDTRLVCKGPEHGTVQADLIVVPHNEESGPGPPVPCLTNRDPTNILTAQSSITVHASSPVQNQTPQRSPSNLLDGVFDLSKDSCYHTNNVSRPYLVFNLGTSRAIRMVQLIAFPGSRAPTTFVNVDVRVGTFPTSEVFTDYVRLGFMMGSAPAEDEGFVFMTDSPEPVVGQYVSVQAYAEIPFIICHVEIYT